MWIFVILLIIPIIMQHIVIKGFYIDYKTRNQRALVFFFALLTILLMFRHADVGNDTRNYIRIFENFSNMDWKNILSMPMEMGFACFNKLFSLISKQPQFFFAVVAFGINAMIYPTYKRLCVDSTLTIVLFCAMPTFVMMFSGIKQMIAIGLGFLVYDFTRRKKPLQATIVAALAVLFHTSAIMLFFMYPLYNVKIRKKWLVVVVPAMAIVFKFNRQFFSFLTLVLEQFTEYTHSMTETGAYAMLLLFFLFAVFSFIIPDENRLDEETIGLRNFLLFSLMLQMFAPLHTIAMRMNYYYIIFIPLLLPKVIEYRRKRWTQVAVIARYVMVGFFSVYFFISLTGDANLNVYPYHFFWERV